MSRDAPPDGRPRYANEAVGALVLLALGVLFTAALQGGVLRAWFHPTATLRVILPEQGLFGLAPGAPVEVLGTKAGEVRRIVIDPPQSFHADVEIDDAMQVFIRRDSVAFIRKQFGIAGAAYLEISRGQGAPLDWDFAVIEARVDRAPTENVGELIEDLRGKMLPIIDETKRAVTALADLLEDFRSPQGALRQTLADVQTITGRLADGEGVVGRMLTDDRLLRDLETTMAAANGLLIQMRPILTELDHSSRHLTALSATMRQQADAVPTLIREASATATSLKLIARDLSQASPAAPALLAQTQQTALELERLLLQLRGHWLLGSDSEAGAGSGERLPPLQVRP